MKRESLILCLVGPAGSGKTSNMQKLLQEFPGNLKNSISVTTRPKRDSEKPGETREFVSIPEFQKLIAEDALFEFEEIHGNYYGTRRSTISEAFAKGYDLIFDIDIQGALNLKKSFPTQTVISFIVAPNTKELVDRISNRDPISKAELETRLATADLEYQMFFDNIDKIDYFVVNQDRLVTYQTLAAVLLAERAKLQRFTKEGILTYVSNN